MAKHFESGEGPQAGANLRVFFDVTNGFDVEDTTTVFPFLNGNDAKSGLPRGLPEFFSMAIGVIAPESSSRIHVHPLVTQVTMVLDGRLDAWLGGPSMPAPLRHRLSANEAVLARPGTFLQLVNLSVLPCRTLYIVGPAYVSDVDDRGAVVYEEAVTLEETWEELAELGWTPPKLLDADVTPAKREAALARVRARQAA